MSTTIPLIRGFALLPTLRWLSANGGSANRRLEEVDLPAGIGANPFRPIPLVHAAALLRNAAKDFGPDLPCRIIAEAANIEIAMLGKVALGARSPGEALMRIVTALPYYCSHEEVSVERQPGRYVVREFFAHKFDPETRHILLQYAAAMIDRVLGMAGDPPPRFVSLELPPHPTFGIRHLRSRFGDTLVEGRSRGLAVVVDERIMHRPFSRVARNRLGVRALDAQPLRGDGTSSGSVRTFIQLTIEAEQTPSLSRVVAAAGTSERSLQRQLEAEGTSFSELLADTRRSETVHRLGDHGMTIASIAAGLGYSDQASFTRAFRRWTGSPPGQFRGRSA